MLAVKKGADRQETHEKLRKLSGQPMAVIAKELKLDLKDLPLIGRAPEQTREFLKNEVEPFLIKYKNVSISIEPVEI